MSYTPINWQTGEIITAEKLNKMDNGWGIGNTPLFNETVTTAESHGLNQAIFNYNEYINYNTITVIFNGTEYTCSDIYQGGVHNYGGLGESGPDFSTYPFVIRSVEGNNSLITSVEGTFNVSVIANVLNVSNNFRQAVSDVVNLDFKVPFLCISGTTSVLEMDAAVNSGRLLYFYSNNICHFITSYRKSPTTNSVSALPAGDENTETYGFNNKMRFTIFTP